MRLIRGYHCFPDIPQGTALTVGNYDGVHLGHQTVLKKLVDTAKQRNLASVLVVFEPMPSELFGGVNTPARITSLREKLLALKELNLDYIVVQRFTKQFAATLATDVIKKHWIKRLHAKHILIGDDFRFGKDRAGDFAMLNQHAAELGYTVENTASICQQGQRISSTEIRRHLENGNLSAVESLLGWPYSISGKVVHGQRLGRTIGFPTANIGLKRQKAALNGVFAVKASAENGVMLGRGVANLGVKPTVNGIKEALEVHVFNDKITPNQLYGQRLNIEFCQRIRGEQKFASVAELQQQIKQDVAAAKQYFEIT